MKACDGSNRGSSIMIACPGWIQHLSRTQPDYTKTGHTYVSPMVFEPYYEAL